MLQGDVGILSEEPGQRLLSIFSGAALECLHALRKIASNYPPAKFDRLYLAGISCICTWNCDVIKEETAKIDAKYPECPELYQYVYLTLLSTLLRSRPGGGGGGGAAPLPAAGHFLPPMEDFYHSFMKRVAEAEDVRRGESFFSLPFAHKRAIYVECFRNSLHDIARKFAGDHHHRPGGVVGGEMDWTRSSSSPPGTRRTHRTHRTHRTQKSFLELRDDDVGSSTDSSSGHGSKLTQEKLEAQQKALVGKQTNGRRRPENTGGEREEDEGSRHSFHEQSKEEREEVTMSGRRATVKEKGEEGSDVGPPASVKTSDSKVIDLKREPPCFYSP